MKPSTLRYLALTLGYCLATCTASAHEVWIEPLPTGQRAVRFAECGDDFEVSPGRLDSLTWPESSEQAADDAVTKRVVTDAAAAWATDMFAASAFVIWYRRRLTLGSV
jgi:hypothetical protein